MRVGELEDHIAQRLDSLETSTKALVQAWETATGIVKFVKVMAGLATALAGLWALAKTYFFGGHA